MSLCIPSSQSVPQLPPSFPTGEDTLRAGAWVQVVPPNQAAGASDWAGGESAHCPPGSPCGCAATDRRTNLKESPSPPKPALNTGVKHRSQGRGPRTLFSKALPANLSVVWLSAAAPAFPPSFQCCLAPFRLGLRLPSLLPPEPPPPPPPSPLPPATPWLCTQLGSLGTLLFGLQFSGHRWHWQMQVLSIRVGKQ